MISIIIPIYNAQKHINKCLDSIWNQTYTDFEVICINDGSIDHSLEILNIHASNHLNMQIINIPNSGQAIARNLGISTAKGDYITFVDIDDYILEDYLLDMINIADSTDSDLIMSDIDRVYEKKCNYLERNFNYYNKMDSFNAIRVFDKKNIIVDTINAPYAKLIKRDFIIDNCIKFLDGYIYEDLYFTQSMLAKNPLISYVSKKNYIYVIRKGTTMTNKKSNINDIYPVMLQVFEQYKKNDAYDYCFNELEYLFLHHILIGHLYRTLNSQPSAFLRELTFAKNMKNEYLFSTNNSYIRNSSFYIKIYFIFLSLN